MTDREHLELDVTVREHDGPEDADAFEQYLTDVFTMYREVDVDVTVGEPEDAADAVTIPEVLDAVGVPEDRREDVAGHVRDAFRREVVAELETETREGLTRGDSDE